MLLIDGYNLLFALFGEGDAPRDVERERKKLVSLLASFGQSKITVVFDGNRYSQSQLIGDSSTVGKLKILFTRSGESADERIVAMAGEARDRKGITVITTDRQIRNAVEKLGVKTIRSETFAGQLHPASSKEGGERPARRKEDGISDAEVDGWMKVFGIDDETKAKNEERKA